jgi:hypothetical protein
MYLMIKKVHNCENSWRLKLGKPAITSGSNTVFDFSVTLYEEPHARFATDGEILAVLLISKKPVRLPNG